MTVSWKFEESAKDYHAILDRVLSLGFDTKDLLHHNPAFVGHVNLARFLALYECYKMVQGLNGHIAEIGVWKASGSLLFGKLVEIFEPHAYTEVHGFDWFEGMSPGENDTDGVKKGSYASDYETILKLIAYQKMDHVVKLHKLDVTTDLPGFFDGQPAQQYKLVFCDAGVYEVVKASIEQFWPRLNRGGIMVFDQYNDPRCPGETRAVTELLSGQIIHGFGWSRQPAAYVIKDED